MNWTITYYSNSVQEEILTMPAGFLGRYLRYSDKMEIYGPDLGMPHTRAMGEGLFELRLKAAEGVALTGLVQRASAVPGPRSGRCYACFSSIMVKIMFLAILLPAL